MFRNYWGASHIPLHNKGNNATLTKEIDILPILRGIPKDAVVVMKMDVEGDEKTLIPSLIQSRLICKISLIYAEFHNGFKMENYPFNCPDSDTEVSKIDDESPCPLLTGEPGNTSIDRMKAELKRRKERKRRRKEGVYEGEEEEAPSRLPSCEGLSCGKAYAPEIETSSFFGVGTAATLVCFGTAFALLLVAAIRLKLVADKKGGQHTYLIE